MFEKKYSKYATVGWMMEMNKRQFLFGGYSYDEEREFKKLREEIKGVKELIEKHINFQIYKLFRY